MMRPAFLLLPLALTLTACAASDGAGIRDPDVFRQVAMRSVIESARPAADVARCFENRAVLLPMSDFKTDEASGRTTYRLRGFGYTFEEIDFETTPTGSLITILMAPNLNSKWNDGFARDRGMPLSACAEATTQNF